MTSTLVPRLGAWPEGDGVRFRVWAPLPRSVDVVLYEDGRVSRTVPLEAEGDGNWSGTVAGVDARDRYRYRLDGRLARADPASMSQPLGVHGPSAVVPSSFDWTDETWSPPRFRDWVLYEMHVGTFTVEGTFSAALQRLPELLDLGVNAVEVMPIAQFPGGRNWGYDGVFPFAAQSTYGGLDGFRSLVDACHAAGLAVVLDVVHNHFGPEGTDVEDFGPYLSRTHKTPWGPALNFDGAGSDGVREFFSESALFWVTQAHVDGLRLDAVHAIVDTTARPFLEELSTSLHGRATSVGRPVAVIAESAHNDPRLVRPGDVGGVGVDGQWDDDFHHALRVALTGERDGYYGDYDGVADLAEAYRHGFVYRGRFFPYLERRHGRPSPPAILCDLVAFSQNHDQVGNRPRGDRLTEHCGFDRLKLAAAATILSPFVPLLFMGEEYAEEAPFPFFSSHGDPKLISAVRTGRREEFAQFAQWQGESPDPQAVATFRSAVLSGDLSRDGWHAILRAWYRRLLSLRRTCEVWPVAEDERPDVVVQDEVLAVRFGAAKQVLLVLALSDEETLVDLSHIPVDVGWSLVADSASPEWDGPGGALPPRLEGGDRVQLCPWQAALYVTQA